jgi:hypothetical protein
MLQRAALYFLGGPDDREALAYAAGMAGTLSSLTIVRFKLRDWVEMGGRDEEMLQDFWTRRLRRKNGGGRRGHCLRRAVHEREVRPAHRRMQRWSPTSGLAEWSSECPELGVLGDMLASRVSILVIQQQPPKNTIGAGNNDY